MNKKELIILKLEKLKELYKQKEEKKWNLKAIIVAINSLKKYEGEIISGKQLEQEIKGIGNKISKRIDEILETGELKELNENDENNIDEKSNYINNLLDITGVGLVRAKKWVEMGIKDIEDLKKGINEKKITSTHHIDIGIKYYNDFKERIEREEIDKMRVIIMNNIKNIDKKILFEICGSYRRGCKDSGDIDILISHPNFIENIQEKKFLDKIVKELKRNNFIVDSLTTKGESKFMGVCKVETSKYYRRIDIRVVDYKSYYTSLLYFTGNKNFNVYLRNVAIEKNYSLNEYGLTDIRDNSTVFFNSEREIFEKLGVTYIIPEERDKF
jgi:DNA polymerase/3'-5' exonuclease PolX